MATESESFVTKFEDAMDDDFNTADALAAVFELVKFSNTNVTGESSAEFAAVSYTHLWRVFCSAITIPERKNTALQQQLLPLKYRRNMVEFT